MFQYQLQLITVYDLSPLKFIHPHKINSFTFKKLKYGKTLDYDAKKNKTIPDGVFQSKTNIVQTELVLKYNRQIQLMEVPKRFFLQFIWKSCTQNLAL